MDDNDSAHSWLKHFDHRTPTDAEIESAKEQLDHPHKLMPPPNDKRAWDDYNMETLRHVLRLIFPGDIHSRAQFYAAIVIQFEQNRAFLKTLGDNGDKLGN